MSEASNSKDGSKQATRRRRDRRRVSLLSVVPVKLTRKFADAIDGVDLTGRRVGQRLALAAEDAKLLLLEGWAELVPDRECRAQPSRSSSAGSSRR